MNNVNLRISFQGQTTEMSWGELHFHLEDSGLPWFKDDNNIFIIGYKEDLELELHD